MSGAVLPLVYIPLHTAQEKIYIYRYVRNYFELSIIHLALRYKSEGRGFDSRWCHWNFSLT